MSHHVVILLLSDCNEEFLTASMDTIIGESSSNLGASLSYLCLPGHIPSHVSDGVGTVTCIETDTGIEWNEATCQGTVATFATVRIIP